ncbi:uncharacterized protein GIQ15_06045 [Arthroderma uncinatum]|uniref:uncharacterized protein n=1 Tax=Arthroderma uncinatum TaxID=74035 RepID=UPI00144AF3EA|nr:uncharacterized protein GIQ15_06045 [Arthroderma uncinatum]KAF3480698.1 hypothetical protein GIQ15_06045 [Arthroderma uncinatum]
MILSRFLVYTFLSALAAATPFTKEPRSRDIQPIREAYPGIFWDDALLQCGDEGFDILVEATRMALEVVTFRIDGPIWELPAWNRYFIGLGGKGGWESSELKGRTFVDIRHNIKQVGMFPRNGKPSRGGPFKRTKQVTYRCKEPELTNRCAQDPSSGGYWRGPTAYTQNPSLTGDGWEIVFCPRFFREDRIRYINRITDGPRLPHTEISRLISYEYAIIHEWMHVDIFGYLFHIEDVVAAVPFHAAQRIYGDSLCHKFAWINLDTIGGPDTGGVNFKTAMNADNYAWFFIYNWFHHKWNWDSNGAFTRRKRLVERDEEPEPYNDLSDTVMDTDIDINKFIIPVNCHVSGNDYRNARCDYVAGDYDDFVKELHEPFYTRKGCVLSAECHLSFGNYAVDPKCTCTCDDEITPLRDPRCEGFAGSLPTPPRT